MNRILNRYFSFPDEVKEIVNEIPENDPLLVSSISATQFVDTVNPVCNETGMRRNDIDVAMTCKDPTYVTLYLVVLQSMLTLSQLIIQVLLMMK